MLTTIELYISGEGIIATVTIIGNSIVLIAIIKYRQLRTPHNVFIGHLAAADVMAGVLAAPLAMITSLDIDMTFHSCILLNSVLVLFANISVFMLLCVTCERYAAIRYPFKYDQILDVPRANYIAVTAWVVGVVTGLMPMFGWNEGAENYGSKCNFLAIVCYTFLVYFNFVFLFLVPIILMTGVYAYIGRVARRHRRDSNNLYSRFNVRMQKNRRKAKSFVVLIAVMFVCKLPLHLLNCMAYYEVTRPWSADMEGKLILISILLDHSNSMVNPFIYAASNSEIKAAMLHMTFGMSKDRESIGSRLTNNVSFHSIDARTISYVNRTSPTVDDVSTMKEGCTTHSKHSTSPLSVRFTIPP